MSAAADEMRRRIEAGEDIGAETWERMDAMSDDPIDVLAVAAGCAGVIMGVALSAAASVHARQEFLAAFRRALAEKLDIPVPWPMPKEES